MSTPETAMDNGQEQREKAEPTFVDINSTEFADEELEGFDDTKDPLEFSIVRDGIYNVELNFAEQDASKHWVQRSGDNGDYLSTRIAARILDGPFANRIVFDGFVSTMVFDGTCAVARVIKAAGGDIKGAKGSIGLARKLSQLLPARARIKVQVQAREEDVKKAFKKGERNFPEKEDGTPDFQKIADSEGPEHGGTVYVESKITRYMEVE